MNYDVITDIKKKYKLTDEDENILQILFTKIRFEAGSVIEYVDVPSSKTGEYEFVISIKIKSVDYIEKEHICNEIFLSFKNDEHLFQKLSSVFFECDKEFYNIYYMDLDSGTKSRLSCYYEWYDKEAYEYANEYKESVCRHLISSNIFAEKYLLPDVDFDFEFFLKLDKSIIEFLYDYVHALTDEKYNQRTLK